MAVVVVMAVVVLVAVLVVVAMLVVVVVLVVVTMAGAGMRCMSVAAGRMRMRVASRRRIATVVPAVLQQAGRTRIGVDLFFLRAAELPAFLVVGMDMGHVLLLHRTRSGWVGRSPACKCNAQE